jgi:hypothetical protein
MFGNMLLIEIVQQLGNVSSHKILFIFYILAEG